MIAMIAKLSPTVRTPRPGGPGPAARRPAAGRSIGGHWLLESRAVQATEQLVDVALGCPKTRSAKFLKRL